MAAEPGEVQTLRPEDPPLVQLYESSIGDIREFLKCKVCARPMYEPYTISCGHTFCYECLTRWFENNRRNKTCPECRAPVMRQPAPSYVIREIARLLSDKPELLPEGETAKEHETLMQDAATQLENDRRKGAGQVPREGLFSGCFRTAARPTGGRFVDHEDGVYRCPFCHWELEEPGYCGNCEEFVDYLDDYNSESEMEGPMIEHMAAAHHFHHHHHRYHHDHDHAHGHSHGPGLGIGPGIRLSSTSDDLSDDENSDDDSSGNTEMDSFIEDDDSDAEFSSDDDQGLSPRVHDFPPQHHSHADTYDVDADTDDGRVALHQHLDVGPEMDSHGFSDDSELQADAWNGLEPSSPADNDDGSNSTVRSATAATSNVMGTVNGGGRGFWEQNDHESSRDDDEDESALEMASSQPSRKRRRIVDDDEDEDEDEEDEAPVSCPRTRRSNRNREGSAPSMPIRRAGSRRSNTRASVAAVA